MTKRIFRSILIVAAAILVACLVIVFGVLYNHFTDLSESQMHDQTLLAAQAVQKEGSAYFNGLDAGSYRITWIDADGAVLYDTEYDAAVMGNHSDRQEFIQAVQTGSGHSSRYSSTLTERMLYYARRLDDGSVIRLASKQSTVFTLLVGMLQPMIIVLIIAVVLSGILASRLAKRIVKPLNELDLNTPLENDAYDELSPLLNRIESQHRQINLQISELHHRQEEWNTVTNSMTEGIVLLNGSNRVLSINRSALKLLGADRNCVGRDFLTLCRRLDIQRLLERSLRGEKAECLMELEGREYQVNASPVLSESETKGTALLFFDVTDKARAEQMRREFTANVSHELKTPLHTISGSAEIIKNGLVEPEDLPRFIDRIYSESQRMITLVDDIIRLSKLDEGTGDMPREPLSLKTMAEDAAKRLAPQAEAKNLTVTVSGGSGSMTGSVPLIAELVYNLCDNAIKYNRDGGSVTVTVEDTATQAVLRVSDTGIGIPADAQDRVFERFYRVDKSHSKEIGGTGLGLSIVKHVARLHGADIELQSRLGEGTSITVAFPK